MLLGGGAPEKIFFFFFFSHNAPVLFFVAMERGPNDKQQKQEPILQIAAADGAARGKREETAADGEGSCEFRAIFRLSEDSTNDRATLFANNLTLIRQLSPDVNLVKVFSFFQGKAKGSLVWIQLNRRVLWTCRTGVNFCFRLRRELHPKGFASRHKKRQRRHVVK